jgi:hypothetical protein
VDRESSPWEVYIEGYGCPRLELTDSLARYAMILPTGHSSETRKLVLRLPDKRKAQPLSDHVCTGLG